MVLMWRPNLSVIGSVGMEVRVEGAPPYHQPTHPAVSAFAILAGSVAFSPLFQGTHLHRMIASVELLCMLL